MRLGKQTMEYYANKFLDMLHYAMYIKDDKVKIQHFVSILPQPYKDQTEFNEPQTLYETIRKAKYFYDKKKSSQNSISHGRIRKIRSFTK